MCAHPIDGPGARHHAQGHGVALGCPHLPVENYEFHGTAWSSHHNVEVSVVVEVRAYGSSGVRPAGMDETNIKGYGADSGGRNRE